MEEHSQNVGKTTFVECERTVLVSCHPAKQNFFIEGLTGSSPPPMNSWKEMALGNRESHQLLAAKGRINFGGTKLFWVVRKNARPR